MPTAPARPCRSPRCAALAVPGRAWCAAHLPLATAAAATTAREQERARGSSAARGYGHRWQTARAAFLATFPLSHGYLVPTQFWAPRLAQDFHTLRSHAARLGTLGAFFTPGGPGARYLEQFPIYAHHPARPAPAAAVDHIRPVTGPDDPYFWAEWNWQGITHAQHSEKTARHDGGYRGAAHRAPPDLPGEPPPSPVSAP